LRAPVGPWSRTVRLWFCEVWSNSIPEQAEFGEGVLFSGSDIEACWPRIPLGQSSRMSLAHRASTRRSSRVWSHKQGTFYENDATESPQEGNEAA
jgi:hypothetical protein